VEEDAATVYGYTVHVEHTVRKREVKREEDAAIVYGYTGTL